MAARRDVCGRLLVGSSYNYVLVQPQAGTYPVGNAFFKLRPSDCEHMPILVFLISEIVNYECVQEKCVMCYRLVSGSTIFHFYLSFFEIKF